MSGDMRVAPASVRLSRILNPEKSAEPGSSGIASVLTASTDAMGGGDVLISERKSSRDVGVPFRTPSRPEEVLRTQPETE